MLRCPGEGSVTLDSMTNSHCSWGPSLERGLLGKLEGWLAELVAPRSQVLQQES